MKVATAFAFALAALLSAPPAHAEDPSEAGRQLPPVCKAEGSQPAPMSMGVGSMDQAHMDLMQGMDAMNANMSEGMTAKDIDVAFICGMIPHHQGAIDMAKAELTHGKDPLARKLAEGIIAAQEKEIAEMLDWLKTKAK